MWISQTRWITIPKIGSLASFCYALASHGPRCESALISRVRCDSIEFRNCFLRPIRSNVLGKSLLRPRYKQLFERYDNGAAELMFVTNHRRNDAHFEQVKNIPFLKGFHMDDLIQCLVGNIDGAMPRTPPISLNGINALLPAAFHPQGRPPEESHGVGTGMGSPSSPGTESGLGTGSWWNAFGIHRPTRLRRRHEIGSHPGSEAAGQLPRTAHTDRRSHSRERSRTNVGRSSFCRDPERRGTI